MAAARSPQAILADAVKATGGEAAWNAHKTARYRVETVFQGMGLSGSGERFVTRTGKAFTTVEMTGLGNVREGTNGSVSWSQEPLHGLRILDGIEAEQSRIGAAWNQDMQAAELFTKLEAANEPGPDGTHARVRDRDAARRRADSQLLRPRARTFKCHSQEFA